MVAASLSLIAPHVNISAVEFSFKVATEQGIRVHLTCLLTSRDATQSLFHRYDGRLHFSLIACLPVHIFEERMVFDFTRSIETEALLGQFVS